MRNFSLGCGPQIGVQNSTSHQHISGPANLGFSINIQTFQPIFEFVDPPKSKIRRNAAGVKEDKRHTKADEYYFYGHELKFGRKIGHFAEWKVEAKWLLYFLNVHLDKKILGAIFSDAIFSDSGARYEGTRYEDSLHSSSPNHQTQSASKISR
ncbi:MAG: hypothetical protein JXX29_12840 [Deltaproteobacteria bacterium]|nr:hypothetical protein [Deltaproteobacteria bacterium]